jgi:hypothetical protein
MTTEQAKVNLPMQCQDQLEDLVMDLVMDLVTHIEKTLPQVACAVVPVIDEIVLIELCQRVLSVHRQMTETGQTTAGVFQGPHKQNNCPGDR